MTHCAVLRPMPSSDYSAWLRHCAHRAFGIHHGVVLWSGSPMLVLARLHCERLPRRLPEALAKLHRKPPEVCTSILHSDSRDGSVRTVCSEQLAARRVQPHGLEIIRHSDVEVLSKAPLQCSDAHPCHAAEILNVDGLGIMFLDILLGQPGDAISDFIHRTNLVFLGPLALASWRNVDRRTRVLGLLSFEPYAVRINRNCGWLHVQM